MSEFNRNNRGDELDESIDFMMKKRKQGGADEYAGRAAQGGDLRPGAKIGATDRRPPAGANGAAQRPQTGANGAAQRPQTGANGAAQRPQAGANGGAQRPQTGVNGAAQRPQAGANGGAQRPQTGANGAAQRPRAGVNGAAQKAAAGVGAAASGAGAKVSSAQTEFVTSGQRIVPKEKSESVPLGEKRPITIKRTNEEIDSQATRKTDMSQRVENEKLKKGAGKKGGSDLGSELVVNMVKAVIYLVFVAVISAVISVFVINVGNDVFAFVKSDEAVEVEIPEEATTSDIAEILYQNGVIKYKGIFELYGKIKEIEENYVAGAYVVSPMMNYKALFYEFKPKKVSGTSWITIPEGYTVDEIIELLLSYEIGGTKEDYTKAINEGEFDYWFVEELEANGWSDDRFYRLEGYLFPDTYEFYNASDAYTVVNKMLKRFSEVYTEAYKARAAEIGYTTDQVVTLASMIEKEAGFSSDFRNVSSVFHNRLNNPGIYPRLESDATVVYAIHHLTGERPTDVTGETISYVSPYNTYQNNGLPPGAIANPGMNALKYALYPAETNYYFFVSSKSGTTLFATNVAGHEANKASIKAEQ